MTRTEDRLAEALAARAAAVRVDSLRPLAASPAGRAHRAWPGLRWLTPLAAGLSVALVAALIAFLAPATRPDAGGPSVPARYYVWWTAFLASGPSPLLVRSAVTGAVVAEVPDPPGFRGWTWVGAARGLRSYIAIANCTGCERYVLYRFRLTEAGQVADLAAIRTLRIRALRSFALSPDGSDLAYVAGFPASSGTHAFQIRVISLSTGRQRVWSGDLRQSGSELAIYALSWNRDGQTLAFGGYWCKHLNSTNREPCGRWTVRSLSAAAPSGSLASSSVLLRKDPTRYKGATAPAMSPAGSAIVQVVSPFVGAVGDAHRHLEQLISVDLSTGRQRILHSWIGIDYHAVYSIGGVVLVLANSPGTSRTPTRVIGWIGRAGTFRRLPTR